MAPPSSGPFPTPRITVRFLGRVPRLVAIDVDGTLLTCAHDLSPATLAAVARVRSRGVDVVLASSRGPSALEPVLRRLGLTAPSVFVASQGAVTGSYGLDGALHVIDRRPMPPESVHPVIDAARDAGIAVSWFAGARWFVSAVDHTIEEEARIVGVSPEQRDLWSEEDGPDKLMLIGPTPDLTTLRAIAAALPAGLRAQVSNPTYLEITRSDVDKADAVRRYCASTGIAASDVVALGDGPNDLGLFAFAGTSVAPASARPEVVAAATFVTRGNDDDGVAAALAVLVP